MKNKRKKKHNALLVKRLSEYWETLDGTNRPTDFVHNGKEYFIIKDLKFPDLWGLVFRMEPENHALAFEVDPREDQ